MIGNLSPCLQDGAASAERLRFAERGRFSPLWAYGSLSLIFWALIITMDGAVLARLRVAAALPLGTRPQWCKSIGRLQ
jgi:hypothetical protein